MRDQTSRVAIIGYGSIGKKHTEIFHNFFSNCSVLVLTSQTQKSLPKLGGVTFVNSYADLIAFRPDFCVVARPSGQRLDIVKKLLDLDTVFLFEKPIASDFYQAQQIEALLVENGRLAYVGYNLRFCKSIFFVQEILRKNVIGKIFSVQCSVGQELAQWRPNRDISETASSSKLFGGGVLRELSHEIDYLCFLFGHGTPCSGILAKQKYGFLDVEDVAMVHFVLTSTNRKVPASMNLDFIRKDPVRWCHIVGEQGTVRWDLLIGKVLVVKQNGSEEVIYSNPLDIHDSYLEMLTSLVTLNTEKFATVTESVKHVKTIEEIEKISRKIHV